MALLRRGFVGSLLAVILAACGAAPTSSPESAPDAAERVGCDDWELVDVLVDWPDFDEAVECELEGANVVILWKQGDIDLQGNTAEHGIAMECVPSTQPECEAAGRAFIRD